MYSLPNFFWLILIISPIHMQLWRALLQVPTQGQEALHCWKLNLHTVQQVRILYASQLEISQIIMPIVHCHDFNLNTWVPVNLVAIT